MANTALEAWALPRLQQLIPLDDENSKEVIRYADTLPKDAAAEHLKNLLGDDGKSLEFISSFNLRRQNAPVASSSAQSMSHARQQGTASSASASDVPRAGGGGGRGGRGGKKRANIHALPARQVAGHGDVSGAYQKRDDGDYTPQSSSSRARQTHKETMADNLALREKPPDATQMPLITDDASATTKPSTSKPPPSAAGSLISDTLAPRKAKSQQSSRNASPAPAKTKIAISGGTAMHGASTTLSDLDSAIKSLEIQTNPSLTPSAADDIKRNCNCIATRHPLLDIAPNCLNCGNIVCVKQGLGPCTSCGSPLLTSDEISKVLRVLKDERGEEKMRTNNASHKKADVAQGKPRAFTGRDFLAQPSNRSSPFSSTPTTPADSDDESQTANAQAQAHRDKLLSFQTNNARRTRIHDEAADYDLPTSGTNMWASPAERAAQLKRQQKVLREVEWAARPEWEKRRVVASIDLHGGKVVRRMAEVERPADSSAAEEEVDDGAQGEVQQRGGAESGGKKGAFSRNPLAAGLVRPKAREAGDEGREKKSTWRRVQMDEDDNEQWILDGGVYGGRGRDIEQRVLGEEEHAFG